MAAGAAIGSAVGSLGGGIFGELMADRDRRRARANQAQALRIIEQLDIPDIEKQRMLAELEQSEQLGPSAMEGVTADPQAIADEKAVLQRLQGITDAGGMDMQARARLADIQDQVGQGNRARREAALSGLRNRGQAGGGMELAAALAGAQDSAGDANRAGLQTAADAERRALQALQMRGGLAGQMRRSSFDEGSARAQARDAIAKFNAMNRQDVGMRNVNRRNEANMYNSGLYQQDFENRFRKAGGMANALTGHAAALEAGADRTANRWGGAGQAAGAAAGYGYDEYEDRRRNGGR